MGTAFVRRDTLGKIVRCMPKSATMLVKLVPGRILRIVIYALKIHIL